MVYKTVLWGRFIKIMLSINLTFENFIQQIKQKEPISEHQLYNGKENTLKMYRIMQITSSNASKIYQAINLKFYKNSPTVIPKKWYENQLKLFVWVFTHYLYLNNQKIQKLEQNDWKFFSTIFNNKDPKIFEYQCYKIFVGSKRKNWDILQEDILQNIMSNLANKKKSVKWSEVSKQLFYLSKKQYFRTPKQCRERWNNHLDPSKVKGFWKPQECIFVFQYVRDYGKKWSNLAKALKGTRNQHSIKNKFNSIYLKYKRLHACQNQNEILDGIIAKIKNSTSKKSISDSEDQSFEISQKQQCAQPYQLIFEKQKQVKSIKTQPSGQKYFPFTENKPYYQFSTQVCKNQKQENQMRYNELYFNQLNFHWNLWTKLSDQPTASPNYNQMYHCYQNGVNNNFTNLYNLNYS